ncbi:MAG TPA: 50S ribosomal protein L7/L12 [Anaerolineae bacterium]|nr:50S ribosomal protein L7/L12 [Anaerolineae bacterium]
MSEKLEKLVQALNELTLLEAAELSKMLQERWGVSAAAPVAMAGIPTAAAAPAAEAAVEEEEKTEFDVVLKDVGPKKIQVIKAVRTFRPDLGLKEAKDLVDSAPIKVLEGVPKDQAESAASALKEQEAVVEII